MSSNVCVDTEALSSGQTNIQGAVDEMISYVNFMLNKLSAVSGEFSSSNYDRISESLYHTKDVFTDIAEKLFDAQNFLKQLSEHIEEYSTFRY